MNYWEKYYNVINSVKPIGMKLAKFPFLVCVIISVAELIVVTSTFYSKFNTNDDAMMMLVSKGLLFANEPSELILYSNFIYGKYLVFFSTLFKQVNFYAINNFILIAFSLTLLRYTFFTYKKAGSYFVLFSIVIFPFSLYLYTNLQFTILASVLFITGIVALFSSFKLEKSILLFLGIVAIIFAELIRFEQTLLILAFVFPFLFVLYLKLEKQKMKFAISLLVLMLFGAGLYFLNTNYYKRANYNFLDANVKMATLFYDYNTLDKVTKEDRVKSLKKLNLPESEVALYETYYVTPSLINNTQNWELKDILKDARKNIDYKLNFRLIKLEVSQFCFRYVFIVFCGILLLFYDFKKDYRKIALIVLFALLYFVLLSQSLGIYLKAMQFRILFSVLMSLFVLAWLYCFVKEVKPTQNVFAFAFISIAILYGVKFVTNFEMRRNTTEEADHRRFKGFFDRLDTNNIYVWNQSVTILNKCNPFDNLNWLTQKIYPLSMLSTHPAVKATFPKLAASFDMEVIENKKIRFILRNQTMGVFTPAIKEYYLTKYNTKIDVKLDEKLSRSVKKNCYFFSNEQ